MQPVPCPRGHYCPAGLVLGLEFPCPPGTVQNQPGASSPGACLPCPPGEPAVPVFDPYVKRVDACFSNEVKDLNPSTGVIVLHSPGGNPACLASAALGGSILCQSFLSVDVSLRGPRRPLTVELL